MAPAAGGTATGLPNSWEPLEIDQEHTAFTLDEDEEPLLLDGAAGASASAANPRLIHRAVSKFTIATESEEEGWNLYRHEAWRIAQLSGPVIVSQFMNFSLNMMSVAFIGRLSEEKMAVAVLATSMMSVTGFSVVMGLLGAMDTLCGQAWGAQNYKALGITLQKAVLTTLATTLAICVLWANMGPLLLAMGQQQDIARGAARYLLLSTPALLLSGMFECLKRYLMAQGVVQPVTVVCSIALALAPLFNWLLIFKLRLGIDGAVAAMVCSNATMLLLLVAYVVWLERRRIGTPEQTWHGWSRDCLQGLGAYYKLAVPSTLMVCLEWWAYELCIFMAGWLEQPTLHVSAMGVMIQVSGLAYMVPMGLSCAVSVRVSNCLGAALPHGARRSAYTATAMTACTQLLLVGVLVLGRHVIGALFTNIPEVLAMCAATFPLVSASMFGDGLNSTISGVLRGAGRQQLGAMLNLASYWGLGLPTAYLLSVKAGLELKGLWGGLILATSVQGMVVLVVLSRFNWQREAQRAAELLAAMDGSAGQGGCGLPCEDSAEKLEHELRQELAAKSGARSVNTGLDVERQ